VGDPWQALYEFRGARPEKILDLLLKENVRTLAINQSFRWQTNVQRELANLLRAGLPGTLPGRGETDVDVVIGTQWQPLWRVGTYVLPLAFRSFRGEIGEAAETLLLNHLTRRTFGHEAVYLRDALSTLGISDQGLLAQIRPELQQIAESLKVSAGAALQGVRTQLVTAVSRISPYAPYPRYSASWLSV